MRTSMLLKMLLTAAMFHMFATDDDTASAATDASAADAPAADAASADTAVTDATADANASPAADVSTDASADASADASQTTTPIVQTPTPVAQPGSAGDPVLETVKTPAHTVAEEIEAELAKLEELPAEVAAWFKAKFVELASHIKALL